MTEELNAKLLSRISAVSSNDSYMSVVRLAGDVFEFAFGTTTDNARMNDFLGEAYEFFRATTRKGRLEEFGDVNSTLGAWSCEQDADPVECMKHTLFKILQKRNLYAARGDKPTAAILGLSGDPTHIGHISMGMTVLDLGLAHEIRYMFANEYFGAKTLLPAETRLEMGGLLPQVDRRLQPFDFEIKHGLFSETISTMLKLVHSEFAETQRFKFLISVELANSIPTWPRWEELVNVIPFITIPRIGYTPKLRNPWFLQRPHTYIDIEDAPRLVDVSSTKVKKLYRSGKFKAASKLMHPLFHRFVMERGLYRSAA